MRIAIVIILILVVAGAAFWIWVANREEAAQEVTTSVSAFNQTKNADATTVSAAARDVIVYTLVVENSSDEVVSGHVTEINIADITESATLIDAQGANYNPTNNSLVWTPLDVPANGSFDKKFTVRVKDVQPASSDYLMNAQFSNEVIIDIERVAVAPTPVPTPTPVPAPTPTPSPVAGKGLTAPVTGPSEWIAVILAATFTLGILLFSQARKLKRS